VVMTKKPTDSGKKTAANTTEKSATNPTRVAEKQIQQGWVVRVGTFSKKANVESVSTLLTNSGFKPRTTAVSTSLGNSTRVWLGPYAKKQTADEISARLKSLIGEKGYVTRVNS
jgi:cell division septation protein DedD